MSALVPPVGKIDVLAIGETVVDLISTDVAESLEVADTYQRFQGGSPANIAANIERLGGRAALVSKIGTDGFGRWIENELERAGLSTDYLVRDPRCLTSVIFVTQTTGDPDFSAYRDADVALTADEVDPRALAEARVVHASTFALSREPCRGAIIESFRRAHAEGKWLSLDPNYRPSVWPDRDEALAVLTDLFRYTTITKPSLDDATALFGETLEPEEVVARFHAMGPRIVALTLGHRGALVSDGTTQELIPARLVRIADATGAGDAYWAGFVMALLDGLTLVDAAYVARELVELKLQMIGPLLQSIDRPSLYQQVEVARNVAATGGASE